MAEEPDKAQRREISVSEMLDALLVLDEPVLLARFHKLVAWHRDPEARRGLSLVPPRLVDLASHVSRGAHRWETVAGLAPALQGSFMTRAQRMLLQAFLELAESRIRMLAFVASHAPTAEARKEFYAAARLQHEVADVLRQLLAREPAPPPKRTPLRSVQEEAPGEGLRHAVETAIRASRAAGKAPRELVVSGNALRHLRDEGLLGPGETTVDGVPVVVDLGWDTSAFVLRTYESVRLEEILAQEGSI